MTTHAVHDMQAPGRGIQGMLPFMLRQSVGQMATQSPQPLQRVAFKTGSSRISFNRCFHKADNQIFDDRPHQRWEENVTRP